MKKQFTELDPVLREKIKGLPPRQKKLMRDIHFGIVKALGQSIEEMERARLRWHHGNN